jgi:dihydroorotate dehydrogenase
VGRRLTLRLLEIQARTAAGRRIFRFFGHGLPDDDLSVTVFGLRFPSPIGLGPGIDTHGVAVPVMQHLGFGFLEAGPVGEFAVPHRFATEPLRVRERQAIVSSWQASGPSAAEMAECVRAAPDLMIPVGMALRGTNLAAAMRAAESAASFFILPAACADDDGNWTTLRATTSKPLLLRISPDWSQRRLEATIEAAACAGLNGCVAVGGAACPLLPEGEIEGPFLQRRALEVVSFVAERYSERFPVIGAGGIATPEDALALFDAGARLIELSAGFVYAGPGLPGRIIHALEHRLEHTATHKPRAAPRLTASNERKEDRSLPDSARALALLSWPCIALTGGVLIASGIFALVLAATVKLLPYDFNYLGMTAEQLCDPYACRIVHFLAHDRVSFGGSIISVGILYLWLALAPLRRGEAWAWWILLVSGLVGFGSFLTYLGYGYLDVWHGMATLLLLPFFVTGLVRAYGTLRKPRGIGCLFRPGARAWLWSPAGMGRACITFTAAGMISGGLVIMGVGMTRVFVPQDLEFMQVTAAELNALNPRLVPLIAHDRAGFGGGLCSGGLTVLFSLWCGARPAQRGLWLALCLAGLVGFSTAIGIHPMVGYTSFIHLLPAYLGAIAFLVGTALLYRPMCLADESSDRFPDL